MTALSWTLLVLAGAVALADWWAVAHRPAATPAPRTSENVLKPAVLVLLVGVALALDATDGGQRAWFVAALVLSLAGDVFLLPSVDRFVPGLASFLFAHVAYVIGFAVVTEVSETDRVVAGLVLVPIAVDAVFVHAAVLRTAPDLRVPVLLYICVIAAMVAWSVVNGDAVAIAGAALFATSDSILALNRFDRHRPWMPLAVMVTYHLAQGLLVLSLAR